MTTEWIVYVLLVGGLLACAAAAAEDILRRAAMPTRWVWVAALLVTTSFTGMSVRRAVPTLNAVNVTKMGVATLPAGADRRGLWEGVVNARAWIDGAAARVLGSAHLRLTAGVQLSLVVAWLGTSAAMLVILFMVHGRMARERRRWPLTQLFGAPVRIAPSEGPAVVGITTPEIVVPRWLLARTAGEQQLVVVHEREHIAARDHLLPLGGLVIAALLPWHPAVWWAASRLRLAIELDCDARVLHRGVPVRPYGRLLIDIAGQCAGHRVGALALADRPSHLERRLLAMKNTKPRFTVVRTGALAAIALLSVAMACEARLPTPAEVDRKDESNGVVANKSEAIDRAIKVARARIEGMRVSETVIQKDVSGVEKAVVKPKPLDNGGVKNVVYTVDGVVVSADKARSLNAKHIAAVRVSKGELTNTTGNGSVATTVNITTGASDERGVPVSVSSDIMKHSAERVAATGTKTFTGLLYVDGVLQSSNSLAALSSNDIESVQVLKGAAAAKISTDPAAANGVIQVTTKHPRQ